MNFCASRLTISFFKRKISGLLTSFCLFTYNVFLHVNVEHEFTSKVLITRGSSQSPTKSSGRVWDEARSGVWNLTPVKSAVGRELCGPLITHGYPGTASTVAMETPTERACCHWKDKFLPNTERLKVLVWVYLTF